MNKHAFLVAVSLFVLACGGSVTPPPEVLLASGPAALSAASDWVVYDVPFDASSTFPPDGVPCFGHQFHFVGNMRVRQKTVTPPDGQQVRLVYSFTYDPPVFTSETGAPWAIVEGGGSHGGVETYLPDWTPIDLQDKDKIPLQNEATGERLTIWGKYHLTTNAAGEVKVANFGIVCTQP